MRVNLMSRLAALAMISPAALAQSGSGADDQTAAPTQAETDVERSDSGPGGQGDTSEGTPQGGSLAEMDDAEMVGRTVVSSDGAQIGEVETVIETPDGQNMLVVTTTGLLGSERSEEHTSELQSLMRISYAVFCLKKKTRPTI